MGPPGSGKGSLSNLCVQRLGFVQVSTGNLCRKHIAEKTPIGLEIDFAIKSGKLIPDSLIVEMVKEWIAGQTEKNNTLIFDGFPRTVNQAEALEVLLKSDETLKLHIVRFAISDQAIIHRLSTRYVCGNKDCQVAYSLAHGSLQAPKHHMKCDVCGSDLVRRLDDVDATVKERLNMYYEHEQDLLHFYRVHGYPIHEFNAEKPLEEVFDDFSNFFNIKHA
jgi:adenylate kinase